MAFSPEQLPEMPYQTEDLLTSSQPMVIPATHNLDIASTLQASRSQHDDSTAMNYHGQDQTDNEDMDLTDEELAGKVFDSDDLLQQDWRTWRDDRTESPTAYEHAAAESIIRSQTAQTCSESDFDSTEYEDYERPKRHLRPQTMAKQTYALPRFDNDSDDETYDPEGQTRQRRVRRKISHPYRDAVYISRCTETGEIWRTTTDDGAFDVRAKTDKREPRNLVITLKFTSEAGRNNFIAQADKLAEPVDDELKDYSLRRRRDAGIESPSAGSLRATGMENHPVSRGCQACAELHEHCSLLEDEVSWPCEHCRADQNDCQLITPPVRFKACENCKRRRSTCSYTTTRNHSWTCQQCAANGESCVARPAKEYIRTRLRYLSVEEEKGWTLPKKKPRRKYSILPERCLECHEACRECHCVPDSDGQYRRGCTDCQHKSLPCTIRNKASVAKVKAVEKVVDRPPSIELGEIQHHKPWQPVHPPAPRQRVATRTLETSLSYPILFNCDAEPKEVAKVCLFCAAPDAAIIGFGLRIITVVDHPDGSQAKNLTRRTKPTSLCTACTTARMSIISCEKHDMQPIIGIYGNDAKLEQFHNNERNDMQNVEELAVYCSICPDMAVYECQAQDNPMDATWGCGMKLCESCALNLDGKHDGNLQRTLDNLKTRLPDGTLQLRADCELLRQDGALSRYLTWLMQ